MKHPDWVPKHERKRLALADKLFRLLGKAIHDPSPDNDAALGRLITEHGQIFVDLMESGTLTGYTGLKLTELQKQYGVGRYNDTSRDVT